MEHNMMKRGGKECLDISEGCWQLVSTRLPHESCGESKPRWMLPSK